MSLQNFVISTLMRMAQRASTKLSAEHRFRRNRRFLAADRSKPGPSVQIKPDMLAGLPVEWVTPRSLAQADTAPICLYLHGGAFVMGGLNSHRDLAAQLAQRAQIRLLMLDYRLAPEHPFPAALEDALAVYRALLQYYSVPAVAGELKAAALLQAVREHVARNKAGRPASSLEVMDSGALFAQLFPNEAAAAPTDEVKHRRLLSFARERLSCRPVVCR
jgi:hypothetical protein